MKNNLKTTLAAYKRVTLDDVANLAERVDNIEKHTPLYLHKLVLTFTTPKDSGIVQINSLSTISKGVTTQSELIQFLNLEDSSCCAISCPAVSIKTKRTINFNAIGLVKETEYLYGGVLTDSNEIILDSDIQITFNKDIVTLL